MQEMENQKALMDHQPEPRDTYRVAYRIHFLLGAGNLLPRNAFITAVDYFGYLYPAKHVEKVFSVGYMSSSVLVLVVMMSSAYFVTVAAVVICSSADGLIAGCLIGSAGKLPKQYMQAIFAGTASSGNTILMTRSAQLSSFAAFFVAISYTSYQSCNSITEFLEMIHFALVLDRGEEDLVASTRFHGKVFDCSIYVPQSIKKATWGCIARLLFYPLFTACLHGPKWLKGEIHMVVLTFMLGLSNGYLTRVLMILAPKSVPVSEAELSAIVLVMFLGIGLVSGSVLGWFRVI
ncbi:hypothetical protein V6N11_059993 [Hibiscus sabdariffa]|uniref:Uncharacterized protein n=1 Tax=Hibiscus sabdariffa TaxID=183260 RepID=A0ABR2NYX1_9ROSI